MKARELCPLRSEWRVGEKAMVKNAKRLFAKFGYGDVTLDEIAHGYKKGEDLLTNETMTISPSLARKYFRKQELLKYIFETSWTVIYKTVVSICNDPQAESPEQKIVRILNEIPWLLVEDLDAFGVLARERFPVEWFSNGGATDTGKPCEDKAPNKDFDLAMKSLLEIRFVVEELQKKGRLDPEMPSDTLVQCLFGAIEQSMFFIYVSYATTQAASWIRRVPRVEEKVKVIIRTLVAIFNGLLRNAETNDLERSHDESGDSRIGKSVE